jgi:acyl-CoA thioesterase FadM
MKLTYKTVIPYEEVNSNGSINGGYTFQLMDLGAVTFINELFMNRMPGTTLVTSSATVKYKVPVFQHEYAEVYAEVINITPGTLTISSILKTRQIKSTEWVTAAMGEFNFSLIDPVTRNIVRIPRKIMNEIKG